LDIGARCVIFINCIGIGICSIHHGSSWATLASLTLMNIECKLTKDP